MKPRNLPSSPIQRKSIIYTHTIVRTIKTEIINNCYAAVKLKSLLLTIRIFFAFNILLLVRRFKIVHVFCLPLLLLLYDFIRNKRRDTSIHLGSKQGLVLHYLFFQEWNTSMQLLLFIFIAKKRKSVFIFFSTDVNTYLKVFNVFFSWLRWFFSFNQTIVLFHHCEPCFFYQHEFLWGHISLFLLFN